MKLKINLFLSVFYCFINLWVFFPKNSWAVGPMYHAIALVAGSGSAGFQDGPFTSARFNFPFGIAINEDSTLLFVADSGNNRIRAIHLNQANRVSTLTGQDKPGNQNGTLASASFNQPKGVLYLPGERLIVNDAGNGLLRLVDLKNGMVSTLAGGPSASLSEGPASLVSMDGIRDMAYFAKADSVYFTKPAQKTLKRLNLKTGMIKNVLHENANIPIPKSICITDENIFIADDGRVLRMGWKNGAETDPELVGTPASNVQSIAANGDHLYALNMNAQTPLMRLLPRMEPVTFVSASGDLLPDPGINLPSFQSEQPLYFVSDPSDERKFFIVNPSLNIITSFRDLFGPKTRWGGFRNSNGLNDDEYPSRKPPKIFRILFCGDSRTTAIVNYPYKTTWNIQTWKDVTGDENMTPPRQISISKRIELQLNTLAALDNIPRGFEVLSLFHNANDPALLLWPTYEVPDIVKKNDIDLVVIFWTPPEIITDYPPFISYFDRPISSEGIPVKNIDAEYLLKPPEERVPEGAPKQLLDMCKARNWLRKNNQGSYFYFDPKIYKDPAFRDVLIQLYGKPLEVLKNKLSNMKTSDGSSVRLLFCLAHTSVFNQPTEDPEMWEELTKKLAIPFLNLNEEVSALTLSFFPLAEVGGNDHLDPDGHLLFSQILAHDLIRDGDIPWFKPTQNQTKP